LTKLDQIVGDGDLGISLSRAAHAIQENLDLLGTQRTPVALTTLSNILRRAIAGSSGPFYAVGLSRAATYLKNSEPTPLAWATALEGACNAISELGGAKPGDRTMLDALYPAAAAFRKALEQGLPWTTAISTAATAAQLGADETAKLLPKRGRSAYIGERALGSPDPGAQAIAVWLRAIGDRP
jgi:dihydroxyacetone kinase